MLDAVTSTGELLSNRYTKRSPQYPQYMNMLYWVYENFNILGKGTFHSLCFKV